MNKKAVIFLLITLIFHLLLFLVKNYYPPLSRPDALEQEHFLNYVKSLRGGQFPGDLEYIDTRYFPGLPFTILFFSYITGNFAVAGLVVTLISLIIIYLTSFYFTKNPFYSFWITIFPPIVYEQTSKISIEALLIALFFVVYFLYSRKKYLSATLLAGFGTVVRPLALFIYLPIFITLVKKRDSKLFFQSLFIYSIFLVFFATFNIGIFGNIFHQAEVYSTVDKVTIPVLQLFVNLYNHAAKGEWRIIVSGLIYVIFSIYLLLKILKNKEDFLVRDDGLFLKVWAVGTFLYIYSIIPIQFLAEARRYLSAFFPLALVVNYKYFSKNIPILIFGVLIMVIAFV